MLEKAVFLDKDGTLIDNLPYNVDPDKIKLADKAADGLRLFKRLGYRLIVVTNQPGVALGHFEEAALGGVQAKLEELFRQEGVELDGFYYCPHSPEGTVAAYSESCLCRKPQPGMLRKAAAKHGVDLAQSWMIGDILHDVEAGRRAGCKTVLIDNGNETEWQINSMRTPNFTAPDLYTAALMTASEDELPVLRQA